MSGARLRRSPVERSSSATTRSPRASSASAMLLPTKPAPPVTSTRMHRLYEAREIGGANQAGDVCVDELVDEVVHEHHSHGPPARLGSDVRRASSGAAAPAEDPKMRTRTRVLDCCS